MKDLAILGPGLAGTIIANKSSRVPPGDERKITIIYRDKTYYYEPGFLFIPLGIEARRMISKTGKPSLLQDLN
jgi:sulfide:quinone oxidoreductase